MNRQEMSSLVDQVAERFARERRRQVAPEAREVMVDAQVPHFDQITTALANGQFTPQDMDRAAWGVLTSADELQGGNGGAPLGADAVRRIVHGNGDGDIICWFFGWC